MDYFTQVKLKPFITFEDSATAKPFVGSFLVLILRDLEVHQASHLNFLPIKVIGFVKVQHFLHQALEILLRYLLALENHHLIGFLLALEILPFGHLPVVQEESLDFLLPIMVLVEQLHVKEFPMKKFILF